MLAEISVTPIDKTQEGFSRYVAQSIAMIKASGLAYQLTPMGTIIEGEPDAVFDLIKQVHLNMRKQSDRVSTAIKIDDRKGRSNCLTAKVAAVESALGEDVNK